MPVYAEGRVEHQKRTQKATTLWPFGFVFSVQLSSLEKRKRSLPGTCRAASYAYVSTLDCDAQRISNLSYKLPADDVEIIPGLLLTKIKLLCSPSIFTKSKRYETTQSEIYSTQSSALTTGGL